MKSREQRHYIQSEHISLRYNPLVIMIGYVLVGAVWLAITDIVAHTLFENGTSYFLAQLIKGMIYIITTGLLVYWLGRRAYRSIQAELVEERLELTERILSAVLGSIGEAVILIDPSGRRIVNCNAAAERIFGYDRRELIGQRTEILHVDHEHFERFGEISEPVLERSQVFRTEYRMRRKDGSTFITANTVSPTHEELGWKAGVVSIVRDITDRKTAEKQVQENLQEKQIMLKEIHHRVKNNLSVITSLLNLQADRIGSEQQAITALHHSRRRIRSMALIHEQLYSSHDFIHVNMRHFVEKMVRSSYLYAASHERTATDMVHTPESRVSPEIHYHYEFEDVFLAVNYAIPCSLILNELLTNAGLHAFPNRQQGDVHISLEEIEEFRFVLSVRDNGRGLPGLQDEKPSQYSADLIERLSRINPDGLGFQIVAALIRQIDAELEVETDSLRGTTFRLYFRQEYSNGEM